MLHTTLRGRRILLPILVGMLFTSPTLLPGDANAQQAGGEPWQLTLRSQKPTVAGKGPSVSLRQQKWDPKETAFVVCDMWDLHHCLNATRRVTEMAPRMNQVLKHARSQGALIIHAPSSCMKAYENHPARLRAMNVTRAGNLPKDIRSWCRFIPAEEKVDYPIDQSDGGEDDDLEEHAKWAEELKSRGRNPRAPWKSQYDKIDIHEQDVISDQGDEIWSVMEHRKIRNVVLVGVHTNMCVLGRPFGLRQMAKNGKNVVLMRDMTDTMYNPLRWPYVSHFQGTRLIVDHIEKYVCPTITSNQLIGGKEFRFANDKPPRAVALIAESLYDTQKTLPPALRATLVRQLGFDLTVLTAEKGQQTIDGLVDAVKAADLLIVSIRRRALPAPQLNAIQHHLKKGKPLIALRTSSHAFDTRGKHPDGHAEWPEFDAAVLGGNYHGHHPAGPVTSISIDPKNQSHELLRGVTDATSKGTWTSQGSLYKSSPLSKDATPLLIGKIDGQTPEPIAWTHVYGKSRVFYTSLGYKSDFENEQFLQLLQNATRWCSNQRIPAAEEGVGPLK